MDGTGGPEVMGKPRTGHWLLERFVMDIADIRNANVSLDEPVEQSTDIRRLGRKAGRRHRIHVEGESERKRAAVLLEMLEL